MMSVKGMIAAGAAALAVAGGAAVAVTFQAHAATPSCGAACVDVFSAIPATPDQPGFVIESYEQGQATGTPIVLADAGHTNPAEDFTVSSPDLVYDFYQAGLVTSYVALHFGCIAGADFPTCPAGSANDYAFEIQYSPYGAPTGECVGLAAAPTAGEHVTLQPCGVSGKTLWIPDTSAPASGFFPLINGEDPSSLGLTYPGTSAGPGTTPTPVLEMASLPESAPDSQLWSLPTGVIAASLSITPPADITVDATGPAGATVTYKLPVVTDTADTTAPTAVCAPPSGSTFPIGTDVVTCTATDGRTLISVVTTSFTITVEGAAAQLASLRQAVEAYPAFNNILALSVELAQQAVAAGNTRMACQDLNAFVNDARVQLPAADAAPLITAAKRIEAVLAC
jgi:hypothetical protein